MYKNQLQELAQRSCFNLPSYTCTREGPDHAPRFKASVNFNGEIFESPTYCSTLRQAEHSTAEVALIALSSKSLAVARVLDESGIYKSLLQETTHRAGLDLPVYTSVRSGPGHIPTFSCSVELGGMSFHGESAKTKKQAEKNAAIAAWLSLRQVPSEGEKEQEVVARVLSRLRPKQVRRRRTLGQDTTTTRDLLYEKLRLNNLSGSHQQTPPQRFWPPRTNLQQQQQPKVKPMLEYAWRKDDRKPEMMKSKSIPLPTKSSMETSCYNKHKTLAPAVHRRAVIPVCSAPPPKPTLNPKTQINHIP